MEVVPQMTNEWEEFQAYTTQPVYTASGKRDTTYLGRFTLVSVKYVGA